VPQIQVPDIDPERDIRLERVLDLPPSQVWAAWTRPELVKQWFCPRPWQVVECEIDLRPGGRFLTVMRGPDGDESRGDGCYLAIVENERLVWTDALGPGYRPNPEPFMTGEIRLAPEGAGATRYTAIARHATPDLRKQHEEMGFRDGWGKAADQLVELMKG